MKLSNQKGIKTISLIALAIGAFYLFFVYYRTICCLWFNDAPDRIIWSTVQKPWQITVLIGYVLGATATFALCAAIEVNILKGLKSGNLFPSKNFILIILTAIMVGVTIFFKANINDVMKGVECSVLDSNCIFIPLIIVIFGLLYKQASLAMEDSNLAI